MRSERISRTTWEFYTSKRKKVVDPYNFADKMKVQTGAKLGCDLVLPGKRLFDDRQIPLFDPFHRFTTADRL